MVTGPTRENEHMTQYPIPQIPPGRARFAFTIEKRRTEQYGMPTVQKLAIIANAAPEPIQQGGQYNWRVNDVKDGVKRGLWLATWESAEGDRLSGWTITGLTDLGYQVLNAWVEKQKNTDES